MSVAAFSVSELANPATERDIAGLAGVLLDAVASDASVSFMADLARAEAEAFWRTCAASAAGGAACIFVARDGGGRIVGTVQLQLPWQPNQPHRADVAKLLVHRAARRGGLGERLMLEAEARALALGRTLLTLDTVRGGDAERLYRRLGWVEVGVIPKYALFPDGSLCDTVVFYREPGGGAAATASPQP